MRSKGYIPKRVHFFLRGPVTVDRAGEQIPCRPGFPVSDSYVVEGKATVSRARSWAGLPQDDLGIVEENTPKSGYRVVGMEARSQGGVVWKVVCPDGRLFDLRDDVFTPILLNEGLPPSGIINQPLQWCVNGSQIRLEAVGSPAHSRYTVREAAIPAPKVATPLERCRVYHFPREDEHRVYLGPVRHNGRRKHAWIWLGWASKHPAKRFHRFWQRAKPGSVSGIVSSSYGVCKATRLEPVPLPDSIFTSPVMSWVDGRHEPLKGEFRVIE